jgi:hypothetical protein
MRRFAANVDDVRTFRGNLHAAVCGFVCREKFAAVGK